MITLQSLITRIDEDFLISELGNEMVMMNTKTGSYIGLNEVGADIWKQLEQPVKFEAIINNLTSKYEVSKDVCEDETLVCLNKMLEQGLIKHS